MGNEVEMDEKYTPYYKGTKTDGVEYLLQKEDYLISSCVSSLQYRDGHTIARTLNYGKPSSIDLLRFGECLESKSFLSTHKLPPVHI